MAGILKGKRSQMVDLAIVLIILLAVGAVMANKVTERNNIIQMGAKQYAMFSAYAEGEKVLEYLKTAGELSISEVAGDCTKAKSLTGDTIAFQVREHMGAYIANYNSTNPGTFTVTLPLTYGYSVINNAAGGSITLLGTTSEDIIIKSAAYSFTYAVKGSFKTVASCEALYKLKPQTTQQLIG